MFSTEANSSEADTEVPKGQRKSRPYSIGRVGVLGAGTMGARIAAHVANAGVPVLLLDRVPESGDRNALAVNALQALKNSKPAAFASVLTLSLVSIGNFEDDLARLKTCDWIIEVVTENLEIKRKLLEKVTQYLHPTAILSTNTSGLPVANIAEQLPADVRRRWLGTHFFNPPRYMRLLEMIATPETDPEVVKAIADFGELRLGKAVVPAKDVQNFIANRVGTFGMLNTFKIMQEQGLTIQEVDTLTGKALGWPKSGTFRLADLVGIDVVASVARNFAVGAQDERSDVTLPEMVSQMLERKLLGDKTRKGFYKKERGVDEKEALLVIDPSTFEYKPSIKVSIPAIEQSTNYHNLAERLRMLLSGDPGSDKAAAFYWKLLPELWTYAANRIGEVAETLVDIDLAITSGFNWELGPFALWDAAGVPMVVARMREQGMLIPNAAEILLAAGGNSWYRAEGTEYFDLASGTYQSLVQNPALANIASYKRSNGVVGGNSGISLVDLGDGVGCFELHSKMNSLGPDTVGFLTKQLKPDSKAVKNFDAFVISTDAQNFSVGANLMHLLLAVQDGEWDEIADTVKQFQAMTQAIKFCSRPVVVAAAGMCLGGGCEMSLHAASRQPHLELYTGLVETGVGLIPGGGGCKEMLIRVVADAGRVKAEPRGESASIVDTIRGVFETIAMAKVSTSASEARDLKLLSELDMISMNRARLTHDGKAQALRFSKAGYTAPAMRKDIPAPGSSTFATLKLGIYLSREGDFISDHDVKIATHVAKALTGGDINPGTLLSEQHLLDLEREAFLSLCGERKTLDRIAYTLKSGKPLRN